MNKRKQNISFFLIIALTVFLTAGFERTLPVSGYASGQDAKTSDEERIETLISEFRKKTKCDDVSVVIYDHGESRFFGDSEGLYQIGSMTKAFTGLAVRKLILEGRIGEDDPVSAYIPGFETYYGQEKAVITVKHLLLQKSGFTNNEKDYPSAQEGMTLSEWADTMSGKALMSLPGTEYAYSNVNYNLLGLIIEKSTGLSYREYMEKEILFPLGLNDTSVGKPDNGNIIEGTRLGFRHVFDFPIAVREGAIPAGYFYSDASDMGRWIGIWTGNETVPENFAEALELTQAGLSAEGDYDSGWELFSGRTIGHSGGTPNYSSRIVFSEEEDIGVCVLTNLNVAATTDSLCNNVFSIVKGKEAEALAGDVWTVFDVIFTIVTIAGIALAAVLLQVRKKTVILIAGSTALILTVLIPVLFPVIFKATLRQILFTWAPWSLTGGLTVLFGDSVLAVTKLIKGKLYANRNKTG